MAKSKATPKKKPLTHPERLAKVVKVAGSEALVAEAIGCSQQSVSAWLKGVNPPRAKWQKKLFEVYSIPQPWVLP